ncbi:MAG: DUF362 domain-containing protein [Chloroflexota bacterium]
MKRLTRRDFLKILTIGSISLAAEQLLTACGIRPEAATPLLSDTSQPPPVTGDPGIPTSTPFGPEAETPVPPTATPTPIPDVVVVRGGEPEEMVRRALQAFGGMAAFVPGGARVIVKPNICVAYHSYEYAATTNPWVVAALVRLCLEAGAASVKVMDFPFGGTAQSAYTRSGIREQVEAAGGQMEIMSNLKYVRTEIPMGQYLRRTDAYQDALEADVLINVPIAKHHGSTRLTLGMKNLMGLIQDRGALHRNLGLSIADLASLFRPRLTVVDAVRILTDNGPSGGNLSDVRKLDTIIVSPDIVAADSYATTLFGLQPEDIAYIPAATALGLGRSDLHNLNIQEVNL